jgi:hypothetical protein
MLADPHGTFKVPWALPGLCLWTRPGVVEVAEIPVMIENHSTVRSTKGQGLAVL